MSCENCQLSNRMSTAERDIQELQAKQDKTSIDAKGMEVTLEYIKKAVDDVKTKIDTLTSAPGKRWDIITNTLIAGVVGIIAAAIMNLIMK